MHIHPALAAVLHQPDYLRDHASAIKQIEITVCRYAKPSGCGNTLIYLMHRVKNMMLSMIGCSDWQRTKRAIQREIDLEFNPKNRVKQIKDLRLSKQEEKLVLNASNKVSQALKNVLSSIISEGLDFAVRVQSKQINDQNSFQDGIRSLGEEFTNKMEELDKENTAKYKKQLGEELFGKTKPFII